MSQSYKVAAAQLAPVFHDRDRTVARACDAIREAGIAGARLVAFPETFIPGYPYWAMTLPPVEINTLLLQLHAESVEIPGPATDALGRAARDAGVYVVMGLQEKDGGTLYNGQLFIGPDGALLGRRRKLVPTSHERLVWGRGDGSDLAVFRTDLGVLGGLICYEHSNALFRYALQGEREEIHVAGWPGGIRSMAGIIDAAVRHYAFEAQVFVVSVSSVLTPPVLDALGPVARGKLAPGGGTTCIVSPRGDVLASVPGDDEGIAYADLDFSLITKMKTIVDSAGHYARPDVVRLEIDRRPKRPVVDVER